MRYLIRSLSVLAIVSLVFAIGGCATHVVGPNQRIDSAYKTWSLFLACSPRFAMKQSNNAIRGLHEQYIAFGKAIGSKHLAVWFSKNAKNPVEIDIERSSRYCSKYKLLPSESPHVLVTTSYPDLNGVVGDYYVVPFGSLNSEQTLYLLTTLTDQLLVNDLNQEELDKAVYWRSWVSVFQEVKKSVIGVIKNVTVTFETKGVKTKIEFK